jgi:hypothetical protein
MSDEATPVVPAVPAAAPTATPSIATPETVSLTKEEHAQLVRDAARASEAQSRADRYEGVLKKNGMLGGSQHFVPRAPVTPPTPEERQSAAADEDMRAERGLRALAFDPIVREALDADPTLRSLFQTNPLAVLPLLAPDALDANDAITLVKDALVKRKPAPATTVPVVPPTPPTPPVGGINANSTEVNPEVEAARKIGNTEGAISGMVAARLKASRGKK